MKQTIVLKWYATSLNKWVDARVGQTYCMKNCEKNQN